MDATTAVIIMGVLWAISEGLAEIPQVKANSTFQLIKGILKAILKK